MSPTSSPGHSSNDANRKPSDSAVLNELGLDSVASGLPQFSESTPTFQELPDHEQIQSSLQTSLGIETHLLEEFDILTFHQLVETIHRHPLTDDQRVLINYFRQASMLPIMKNPSGDGRPIVAANIDRPADRMPLGSDAFRIEFTDVLQQAGMAAAEVVFLLLDGETFERLFEGEETDPARRYLGGEPALPPLVVSDDARRKFLHTLDTDQDARQTAYTLIQFAIGKRASDLHIEPHGPEHYRIRLRIDGHLQPLEQPLSHRYGEQVVRAIAGRAGLEIDKWFTGHDGGIKFSSEEIKWNPDLDGWTLRVSIVPAARGPKAVLRLLQTNIAPSQFTLRGLGYSRSELNTIHRQLEASTGLILMTGPTGSGKTTSLYAMLNQLNHEDRNLVTIEDPIEYELLGLTQCSANPKGFTFEQALRHFMRQDPDTILVGEIRDRETASAAIRAAATGHLVLSTVHTNDSVSTVERLLDLELDRSQIATSLQMVIAQRLVRKCCRDCSEWKDGRGRLNRLLGEDLFETAVPVRHVEGLPGRRCRHCRGQGYVGRRAVAEIWTLDDQAREMVYRGNVRERQLLESAIQAGMTPLWQRGLELVALGVTTLDEFVAKVVTSTSTIRDFRHTVYSRLCEILERKKREAANSETAAVG